MRQGKGKARTGVGKGIGRQVTMGGMGKGEAPRGGRERQGRRD